MTALSSMFSWNPALRLPEACALALLFIALALWLAWKGSPSGWTRGVLVGLRALAVAAVAVLWLNPGTWIRRHEDAARQWLILLDRSASMTAEHDVSSSRWEAGKKAARELCEAAEQSGKAQVRTFAAQLEAAVENPEASVPDGKATNLHRSLSAALDQGAAVLAGIVVLSDGRENDPGDLEKVALRARGLGIPVHTVPMGSAWGIKDIALQASPKHVLAFDDQPAHLTARVENHGLGNIRPAVKLIAPDGTVADQAAVELKDGERKAVSFGIMPPQEGGNFKIVTETWPGEQLAENNLDTVRVSRLNAKLRVLLLEGAPYWDSKFLAQLLRKQPAIQIETIHCLNEDRFFRVSAEGVTPLSNPEEVFPGSPEALARYDLVVFGKGAELFITPERAATLTSFVRDQGGAVLFARGKPYGARFPAIENLEPLEWDAAGGGKCRFLPAGDGTEGLFGAVLPSADDSLWQALPPLEDVQSVVRLKPFARVIAEGAGEEGHVRVPLLVVRRFGRGMVATVNADGLWRWEFRQDDNEENRVFQQFWVQLMQWCATYSEFRPGEDFAVRLRQTAVRPGAAVRAIISWRGPASESPHPELGVFKEGVRVAGAATTVLPGQEGGREWAGVVSLQEPGAYSIRVRNLSHPDREEGDVSLLVKAPGVESDDLRPDRDTLARLARTSGGEVFEAAEIGRLVAIIRDGDEAALAEGKTEWKPLWPQWWVALLVCAMFGSEWWLRRREGLL